MTKKLLLVIPLILVAACSSTSRKGKQCEWSYDQKDLAWDNAKIALRKADKSADDFYDLNAQGAYLAYWESGTYCRLIPPNNPHPKVNYLDGGVFVYFNKQDQSVNKIVPIAW